VSGCCVRIKMVQGVIHNILILLGVPMGSRTPVTGVKGPCPRPLDDGDVVGLLFMQVAPYILLKVECQVLAQ
jgi:hypothetical protein